MMSLSQRHITIFDLPLPPIGIFWAWIVLLLLTYSLPWLINPGNGLTVNAYDLAEWTSLSPVVRTQPLLYTSLFLRLPLMLITWLIALVTPQPRFSIVWLCHTALCLSLVIAQMPPLEFLMQPNDPNYQQQFGLASLSLFGVFLGLSGWLHRIRFWLIQGTIILALIALIMGHTQAMPLMQQFHLPAVTGLGFWGMLGLWGVGWLGGIVALLKRNRAA